MNQYKITLRVSAIFIIMVLVMGIFSIRLYSVQVKDHDSTKVNGVAGTYTYSTRVTAARGQILDRNGNILVGNRASFNINLVYDVLFSSDDPNENLRRLTNMAIENGLTITDHLPVTLSKPYEYRKDEFSSQWSDYLTTYLTERDWDTDISAPQLIRRLKDRYNFPEDWTEDEVRRVISVRYELELRHCTNLPVYVFAEDVDADALAEMMELNIPGAFVQSSTVREYYTDLAAHILGTVGPMNSTEYEYYQKLDYPMDAYVGKSGFELAFEEQLHATDGMLETTIAADGTIVDEHYSVEPKAGNNIQLTIDIDMQQATEDALAEMFQVLQSGELNEYHTGSDASGGACVVMSVKTGEVLACASYPTFNLSTYREDYSELVKDKFNPLFNRALEGTYPPGSIFKPCTTIAALESGSIDPDITIEDKGVYWRFEDQGYLPRCMLWTTMMATHGTLTIQEALQKSCNYFFYEIGWRTGIENIEKTAKALGLGEYTGVEIAEAKGVRASPEAKAKTFDGDAGIWFGGDTVAAAIGQSSHEYTPIQMCSYAATLANQGTRYKATFLKSIISSDYETIIQKNEPVILSQLDISDQTYDIYTDGMQRSAYKGTASSYLRELQDTLGIQVCAKTGTAEHGTGGSDNAAFICFAPKDDPQIAIAVYAERAANSSFLGQIPMKLIQFYYNQSAYLDTVPAENRLD